MKKLILTIVTIFTTSGVFAAGEAGGLTLLESAGARSSSLGEAFTAATNDISASRYNPASLGTLDTGHASFMYQKGLAEDAYGQLLIGGPRGNGGWGLNVGYYDGGDLSLYDGATERTVKAQQDLIVGLGYSRQMMGMTVGIGGNYISSELADTAKATAFAANFGLNMPISNRLQFGASVLNVGNKLKFVQEGDDLPRVGAAGLAYSFAPGGMPSTLYIDGKYFMVDQEFEPSVGLEVNFGPLAMRAGYKNSEEANEFSIGSGFALGRSSLDYSFGMVDDQFDSLHRISLSMRYGGVDSSKDKFVRKRAPKQKKAKRERRAIVEFKNTEVKKPVAASGRRTLGDSAKGDRRLSRKKGHQVYTIKPGDSLGKIANRYYGSYANWKIVFNANKHLIEDPRSIEVGQKIILP